MKPHTKLIVAISAMVALALVSIAVASYTTYTPITDVTITSPDDGDTVYAGQAYTLTCTTSTDVDCRDGTQTQNDPVVHTWSGPGTFNPSTGTTVTWIPPRADGNAVITVTASDNSSPYYADDTDKTDSITLTVLNTLYYVDVDANGMDDGTSWTDAFNHIQDALDAAGNGDEIWVAEGTYVLPSALDVNKAVKVYGGFSATETSRSQRHWGANPTIIDGNGICGCLMVSAACTIDGFTIANGDANEGGGMYCTSSVCPTITNCVFSSNSAYNCGGGLYYGNGAFPAITNCLFAENIAPSGGAMYGYGPVSPAVVNSTFSGNYATYDGGGIYSNGTAPRMTNCIFWGNYAGRDGDEVFNANSGDPNWSYSDIRGCGGSGGGWDPNFGSDAGGNIDSNPYFSDPNDYDGMNGIFMTCDDGLYLDPNSPCIDAGDNTAINEPYDIIKNARKIDGDGNSSAVVDMGAYEYDPNLFCAD